MSDETRSMNYGGTEYTVVARRKNKHRRQLRRVVRQLEAAGLEDVNEYAAQVVYIVSVTGKGWKPAAPDSPLDVLLKNFHEWEEVDSELTDRLTEAIYLPPLDATTAPLPLADDDDPNGLHAG